MNTKRSVQVDLWDFTWDGREIKAYQAGTQKRTMGVSYDEGFLCEEPGFKAALRKAKLLLFEGNECSRDLK